MSKSENSPIDSNRKLRIAYLSYRGKPHCGGQGVYTRHLTKALADLGHSVVVLSGQPYPELDERVELVRLPSLDIFNDHFPMRKPRIWELKTKWDFLEVASFNTGNFSEPLSFSLRAWDYLKSKRDEFDLVHDNQCLGTGILKIHEAGLPVLETIHHPITVDRRLETKHATTPWKRFTKNRFYAFTTMQTKVAKKLPRILTVSSNSHDDIVKDHGVDPERLHIVHVGVDPQQFRPLTDVDVVPGRLMTTASADVAMKGLAFLLEALAKLRAEDDTIHLVVIGKPKYDSRSTQLIKELDLSNSIEFITGVSDQRIVELYNQAQLAVVPSLYEGFSLPAIEAMSCGVPLIATTGGALPEVVGDDGATALQVPPGDSEALSEKIKWGLAEKDLRSTVGVAGRERVIRNFSWTITAERTVEHYRALLQEMNR